MRGYKVCIDDEVHDWERVCYSEFFSDLKCALDYVLNFETDNNFDVRIFPVELKVKYPWSKEFEDK